MLKVSICKCSCGERIFRYVCHEHSSTYHKYLYTEYTLLEDSEVI